MLDFARARRMMVDGQVRTFDVRDPALLAAMEVIPREAFVPGGQEDLAYSDRDVVLDGGGDRRAMLAPMVLARLIQGLEVGRGEKVLDVGCGFGYATAILHRLGADVVGLESVEALAQESRRRLAAVGVAAVTVAVGPLDRGWSEAAPYDAILVNGAVDVPPRGLLQQLRPEGGRLACIEGRGRAGRAMLYLRSGDAFGSRALFDAAAPLLSDFRQEPGFVF